MNETMSSPFGLPPIPTRAVQGRITFSGRRPDFRRLVMRGTALELVTVGFYRFWLATDMRRHLWSNTAVDGDAAEYTGTAKELLIGFLFALAILAPIYLIYFLIGLEAERLRAFASVPLGLFFYLFAQFAIYRARRYRLTRTVWRGVRFWMTGSGWSYAWRAGLWALLSVLTLGIAVPWAKASLERYKMRHTAYGNLQGRFEATGWSLFKQVWWLWLLVWPSFVILIPLPFIYGALKAREWRWWIGGSRIGDVSFESSLTGSALIGLYWKVIGWVLVLAVVFAAYLALCSGLVASMSGMPISQFFAPQVLLKSVPLLILAGLGYLVFALALNVVMRVYLLRDLWVRALASTIVHDIEAAANVSARGEMANALGEGFADGLDVAGF